jgi:glycosyltransferase involved in cell wall biosynthesis
VVIKILHITPHLGGGVGQVLLNWLVYDKKTVHSIATLDFANEKSLKISKEECINIYSDMHKNIDGLIKLIEKSDIVLVHFWNHPLLYDFLVNTLLPPCRMIFWAHISGFEPPYVFTDKTFKFPDKFVFTTPLSFNAKEVKIFDKKENFAAILSTGGIEHVKDIKPTPHGCFNVGYIGTVDYAKMHPDYIEVHKKIADAKFIVVGGDNHEKIALSADERFFFTGKVEDIRFYLAQMDCLGYLLNEKHYGTGEQVLQEAMAAGVVPVVLNNPTESMLVKHLKTGLVAQNIEEYIKYIEILRDDPVYRKKLSENAKKYAESEFSLARLSQKWDELFDKIIEARKKERIWKKDAGKLSPAELYIESLGEYALPLKKMDRGGIKRLFDTNPMFYSKNKGSVLQYLQFFSEDEVLQEWATLI